MSLLKTGQCFTEELALNCPTIVACVTALPTGPAAVAGDRVLGKDGQYHALPAAPAQVPQALTLAGQTLSLSNGGGSVTLPDSDAQALSIAGNVISLTNGGSVTLPTTAAPAAQTLSIAGNTVSLSGGGGSVTVPDAQALSIAGNVISLTNGGSVTLPAAAVPFATPAQTIAGTSTTLAVNPADLYARENIAAQTGLGLVLSAIPAPAANQSPWGVNTLGETLHYAPGLGWQIVDNRYGVSTSLAAPVSVTNAVIYPFMSLTAPRAGKVLVTGDLMFQANDGNAMNLESCAIYLSINGVLKHRFGGESADPNSNKVGVREFSGAAGDITVAAGDILTLDGQAGFSSGFVKALPSLSSFTLSYLV